MIKIKGKYNTAKVFTDKLEETARRQILSICNLEFLKDTKIRIMPDVHTGIGCTIGTTMTIKDNVIPNLVGVDIGCGIEVSQIKERRIDLRQLDRIINNYIPSGYNIHNRVVKSFPKLRTLNCYNKLRNISRIEKSVGTLGGGNHFIEVNKDKANNLYIAIHSGSRNLGKQVADYYQSLAHRRLKQKGEKVPRDLAYLQGKDFDKYIEDMKSCQEYAVLNREIMMDIILNKLSLNVAEQFTTIHNYIDMDTLTLRKGAVSAQIGEKLIVPINMRDGSLICIGKGNADWNYSAPHGAGRIMSRRQARQTLSMAKFKEAMRGIYSTSVLPATIDEAPDAYKPVTEILEHIKDTVEVLDTIVPIYNYKAKNW